MKFLWGRSRAKEYRCVIYRESQGSCRVSIWEVGGCVGSLHREGRPGCESGVFVQMVMDKVIKACHLQGLWEI